MNSILFLPRGSAPRTPRHALARSLAMAGSEIATSRGSAGLSRSRRVVRLLSERERVGHHGPRHEHYELDHRPSFCPSVARPSQGPGHHRHRHTRAGDWRQRSDLQRRARRAAEAARQSRRGPAHLHPAERAGDRDGERGLLGPRAEGSPGAGEVAQRVRGFFDDRLHDDRARRPAHRSRGRRRRLLLRRDGAQAGDGAAARALGRWADGGRSGGADVPVLDERVQERSQRHRQTGPAERSFGDDRRRARAVGAVSAGDRDHRQRRDEPASSRRDDGRRAGAPDDGALRPPGAGRDARCGARGTARRARGDGQGASRVLREAGRLPHRRQGAAGRDRFAGADNPAGAARGVGPGVHRRVLERREPDPRAVGAA